MLRSLALLAATVVAFADPPVPRPSPELNIPLAGGGDFRLSDLRGKVVALEFIYTTCPHCQQFSQLLDKLAREYHDRGFRAVAVAFNENAEMLAPEFAAEFAVGFPIGICTYDQFFAYVGVPPRQVTLPHLFFIGRNGMIRAHYGGDDAFFTREEASTRAMIETLLKERASKSRKHKN
jgi:thiol-disulfide isomerase/thioredoxin